MNATHIFQKVTSVFSSLALVAALVPLATFGALAAMTEEAWGATYSSVSEGTVTIGSGGSAAMVDYGSEEGVYFVQTSTTSSVASMKVWDTDNLSKYSSKFHFVQYGTTTTSVRIGFNSTSKTGSIDFHVYKYDDEALVDACTSTTDLDVGTSQSVSATSLNGKATCYTFTTDAAGIYTISYAHSGLTANFSHSAVYYAIYAHEAADDTDFSEWATTSSGGTDASGSATLALSCEADTTYEYYVVTGYSTSYEETGGAVPSFSTVVNYRAPDFTQLTPSGSVKVGDTYSSVSSTAGACTCRVLVPSESGETTVSATPATDDDIDSLGGTVAYIVDNASNVVASGVSMDGTAEATADLVAGEGYRIAILPLDEEGTGEMTVSITQTTLADAASEVLSSGTATSAGTVAEGEEGSLDVDVESGEVATYDFTPDESGLFDVTLAHDGWSGDSNICYVVCASSSGSDEASVATYTGDDDAGSATLTLAAAAQETTEIAVAAIAVGEDVPSLTLSVCDAAPDGADVVEAASSSSAPALEADSTTALDVGDDGFALATVTPDSADLWTITATPGEGSDAAAVYVFDSAGELTTSSVGDPAAASAVLAAGETYTVAVGVTGGDESASTVEVATSLSSGSLTADGDAIEVDTGDDGTATYVFTPTESGFYVVSTSSSEDAADTTVSVCDADGNIVATSSGEDTSVRAALVAGETYVIVVEDGTLDTGTLSLSLGSVDVGDAVASVLSEDATESAGTLSGTEDATIESLASGEVVTFELDTSADDYVGVTASHDVTSATGSDSDGSDDSDDDADSDGSEDSDDDADSGSSSSSALESIIEYWVLVYSISSTDAVVSTGDSSSDDTDGDSDSDASVEVTVIDSDSYAGTDATGSATASAVTDDSGEYGVAVVAFGDDTPALSLSAVDLSPDVSSIFSSSDSEAADGTTVETDATITSGDTTETATFSEPGEYASYTLSPTLSGVYTFSTSSTDAVNSTPLDSDDSSDSDSSDSSDGSDSSSSDDADSTADVVYTVIYLYDSEGNLIASASGEDASITCELEEGVTYYVFVTNYYYSSTDSFDVSLSKPSLENAVVNVASATYTGSAIVPSATVTVSGSTLVKGEHYTLSATNNVNAGTATLTVQGTGDYDGSVVQTFAISKAANGLSVASKKAVTVKKKTKKGVVKKNTTVKASKLMSVSAANGSTTCSATTVKRGAKKVSGSQLKKLTVAKNGNVTLKKGLKKGTYKVTIAVVAAGDSNHESATKTATVTLKVK